ncbi:hypothetical protein DRH29_00555 [candidate division Kazan bacterium]|uniref:Uncharacterized protein n=1 Tax=candidate division Kazan bacterium TaxID=2202143 RepID=A0A420ZE64_UNCK3|nr:MAG: hypothetical protein DRH29_00555 [candidate division Kazan bacterium]
MEGWSSLITVLGIELLIVVLWAAWAYYYDRRKIRELSLSHEDAKLLPGFWPYLAPTIISTLFVGWYQILNGAVFKGIILFVLYIVAQNYSETITWWPGLILWFYATNDAINLFRMRHMVTKIYQRYQDPNLIDK